MTEQWRELKETITEMRDNDGTGTQQDACKFLANYMEVLEKQMQQPCEDCISRQAVLEGLTSIAKAKAKSNAQKSMMGRCMFFVEQLPPVTPRTNLAETSQDCISRQKALDCFEQTNTRQGAKYAIETLPSVKPKYTDEEIDRAQAVEQAYVDKMVELAVEETKRPNGKWIEHPHERGLDWEYPMFECSECHEWTDSDYDYCPNCGAEMNGGREDEV